MEEPYFRIGQAAKKLGVSIQTLKNWLKLHKIHSTRTLAGENCFSRSEINQILGIHLSTNRKTVLYARVSARDPMKDLQLST